MNSDANIITNMSPCQQPHGAMEVDGRKTYVHQLGVTIRFLNRWRSFVPFWNGQDLFVLHSGNKRYPYRKWIALFYKKNINFFKPIDDSAGEEVGVRRLCNGVYWKGWRSQGQRAFVLKWEKFICQGFFFKVMDEITTSPLKLKPKSLSCCDMTIHTQIVIHWLTSIIFSLMLSTLRVSDPSTDSWTS